MAQNSPFVLGPQAGYKGSLKTGGVLIMLEEKIRDAGALPSESDLQAMAPAIYEELLVEMCTN